MQFTFDNSVHLIEDYLKTVPSYPDNFSGRGIVTCAGGRKYLTAAYVLFRQLRKHGCRLPIECWYLGVGERDEQILTACQDLGVEFIDAYQVREQHPHLNLNGYEVKPFSILHSKFKDVLFLDADNVPLRDPTYLFTGQFEKTDLFWEDYWRCPKEHACWKVFGIEPKEEYEQESGQLVINKQRSWAALNLCNWVNQYGAENLWDLAKLHGDKCTFRLSWYKTNTAFQYCPTHLTADIPSTMSQHDWTGKKLFLHRNMAKWELLGANRKLFGFEQEEDCLKFLEELRCLVYENTENKSVDHLIGKKFVYHRIGIDQREIILGQEGTVIIGGADCEAYFRMKQGRLEILGRYGDLTAVLQPIKNPTDNRLLYFGQWLNHERCYVLLAEEP